MRIVGKESKIRTAGWEQECFLIKTCLHSDYSLTTVQSAFGESFTFSASGSPGLQRESLWFLYFTFRFSCMQGDATVKHQAWRRGIFEVQFSEVVCW